MGLQSQADAYKNRTRKPPKFTHLPEQRARKLKKAWVDKQKVKSKWKATKRKEGLGEGPLRVNDASVRDEQIVSENTSKPDDNAHPPESKLPLRGKAGSSRLNKPDHVHETPDLRELRRQAYAPESLHTHKADPLHRRRGGSSQNRGRDTPSSRGRGGPAEANGRPFEPRNRSGRGGRGAISSSTQSHGRHPQSDRSPIVHGQPNMRLRMNAMLEQIKRDIA